MAFSLLLRLFFNLLYHPFAWAYDLVAATVSLGQWNDWVLSVLPYIKGARVLELGHGPGHLQAALQEQGRFAVGLDESRQMSNLARRRLQRGGHLPFRLTRAVAQALPFAPQTFDTVVATFPTEFFLEENTLSEIRRVLRKEGCYVVLPVAWLTGSTPLRRLMAFLFRITGQAPEDPLPTIRPAFQQAGFRVTAHFVEMRLSRVLIVTARPATDPPV